VSLLQRVIVEKRRVLLPLAVAIAGNVAVYALVVYPLHQRVTSGESRAARAAFQRGVAERDLATARATLSGKQRAEADLQKFYGSVLPHDAAVARRALYVRLSQLARESNLRLLRETSEESRDDKESQLSRLQANLSLEGGYEDVRRFIHAIETAPEFLIVDNVTLSQRQDPNAPLTLALTVSTYYLSGGSGRNET
jgi:Tfp pilus assembly protein PilO